CVAGGCTAASLRSYRRVAFTESARAGQAARPARVRPSRAADAVGKGSVRGETDVTQRRLYLASRGLVARHYRRRLTLALLARALCTSPRQIQRAYERFGVRTFQEDLRACRLAAAATLLYEQPAIPVADVARLVGYRQAAHFARAFRDRFG